MQLQLLKFQTIEFTEQNTVINQLLARLHENATYTYFAYQQAFCNRSLWSYLNNASPHTHTPVTVPAPAKVKLLISFTYFMTLQCKCHRELNLSN